jgi:transcription antitermination protein NusB
MGSRRLGRECAVQFLYQCDACRPTNLPEALKGFWQMVEASAQTKTFAETLISGALEQLEEIDTKIKSLADNWDFKRLAAVDRAILRLAMHEMLHRSDIPPVVSINEAIDIAKSYSTEESGRFVNGLLDQAKKDLLRPSRQAAGDGAA